ncbi:hypothetical protein QBC38DRAFT_486553 [Podospora fimiseda]|uniref:Uncharacterized protein n=1 Tax=Podospora fimiseda TaxID=252190 RepID=A0AAN7GZ75_9PEZI|nr:hypothetical protein QBC38DRAFT_486553 [Podospora fimiseda]
MSNTQCFTMHCVQGNDPKKETLHTVFPELHVRPRPRPVNASKTDYDAWTKEYDEWRNLRCPCGTGYFCRDHGSWVSGQQVRDGVAAPVDEQKEGSCPASHYGAHNGVTSYIGTRDSVDAPKQEH